MFARHPAEGTPLLFLFRLFAFTGSAFLWGEGFILNPPGGVDLAFPITDILITVDRMLGI